ncbi:hypothetical protein MUK42_13111 [Musa troglodytarum]|uniref:Uncharacterized protein n=1 Tax=Musa troglodytarum TaxID=320322 RepID=A0A9E7H5M2_9LILI|nr:hypothetical protein MUK42_13111 [Musa troglodytarum]
MWPPKACPTANSMPQMEHRCTLRLEAERSVLGRLWLVRWPPSAWNVGNWRLHVLHSKTPTTALGSLWVFAVVAPQESDSSSSASSSSALELFMYWDGDDRALHPNMYCIDLPRHICLYRHTRTHSPPCIWSRLQIAISGKVPKT